MCTTKGTILQVNSSRVAVRGIPLNKRPRARLTKEVGRHRRPHHAQSDESDIHGVLLLVSDEKFGVSLCDITAGMNAVIGILEALLQRERTGRGSVVKVSLFDSAADLMAVPYLQARYGGSEPKRVGLKHPSIAPYGSFTCADDRELVISIQNEREWASFCRIVLGDESLPKDPRFCSNAVRTRVGGCESTRKSGCEVAF